ncbi:MAG: Alanine racemase, biosynthetic [Hyphomicrobiaceae bacterium hypho_1]
MVQSPYQPASLLKVPVSARAIIEIDVDAICRNWKKLSTISSAAECGAVVKADAYGLGLGPVVTALNTEGCKTFFVATLEEGRQTRHIAPNAKIYIFDGLLPGTETQYRNFNLKPVLSSIQEIKEWAQFCKSINYQLDAAIQVNTGMRRLGVSHKEFLNLASRQYREVLTSFNLTLIMSHLVCSDVPDHPYNSAQLFQFLDISRQLSEVQCSLANSSGIFLGSEFHFDVVRPGIALYGGKKFAGGLNPMEMVVKLYARILQLQSAEPGETVGYGATHKLKRRTKIATIALGYADGFMRALGGDNTKSAFSGFIGDIPVPVIGQVSMDLITLDVTDVPENLVFRGGWIELIGERMTVDNLADHAGTIGYEILTRLGHRAHRIYIPSRI